MRKNLQTGSAHLVVIIVLVVVLLGALGFVFWQNFLNNPVTKIDQHPTNDNAPSISQPTADDTELTQTASTSYGDTSLILKYPKSWEETSGDTGPSTITSPDGKVYIEFTLVPPEGIGGTCGDAAEANPMQDPIVSAKWAAIPASPKSIFSARIVRGGVKSDVYYYGFGAVRNTDEIKNIQVGASACVPFMFASYIDLDVVSGATLRAVVTFKNLEENNSMKANLTKAEIETEFESANAKVAEAIIESITVK